MPLTDTGVFANGTRRLRDEDGVTLWLEIGDSVSFSFLDYLGQGLQICPLINHWLIVTPVIAVQRQHNFSRNIKDYRCMHLTQRTKQEA